MFTLVGKVAFGYDLQVLVPQETIVLAKNHTMTMRRALEYICSTVLVWRLFLPDWIVNLNKYSVQCVNECDTYMSEILAQRANQTEQEHNHDLLSMLFALNENAQHEKDTKLTLREIKSDIMAFLIAGHVYLHYFD